MRRAATVGAAFSLAAASLIGFSTARPAAALTPPVAITADDLPTWQTNGVVWALAQSGGVVYAGGTFSSVRPPGAAAGTSEQKALNFQAFNAATGAPTSCKLSFTVGTGTATVRALAVSPDKSTLYAGGTFGAVNGTAVSNLAAISLPGCTVKPTFKVSVSSQVRGLAVTADTVYLAGNFSTVAGKTRQHFAAVTTTGALKPFTANTDKAGKAVLVSPDGGKVVIGGDFDTVNGVSSHALAVVNATSGANVKTYPGFIPAASTVQHLAADSTSFYTGNEGNGHMVFDGRIAVDFKDLNQRWRDTCLGATQSVEVYQGVLYSASHAHDCSTMGEFPQMNDRQHLLAEPVSSPKLLGWFPDTDDGPTGTEQIGPRALSFAASGGVEYLWVGGEFTRIASDGNKPQQSLVRFASTPDTRAPSVPQQVTAANATGGAVKLSWQASLDLDDSTLVYRIYRDGTQIGAVYAASLFWQRPTLSFTDTKASPGTTYSYQVTAGDAPGNTSAKSAAASVTTPGTPTSATVTVNDSADSYVNASAASANYGSDQQLAVRGSSAYNGYLRFALPAAPSGMVLKGARLTVRTSSDSIAGSTDTIGVQQVTGTWTETGVTWANKPALASAALGSITSPSAVQTDYSATLTTSAVSARLGSTLDLALTSTGTDSAWFWSRNAPGTSGHPQLTLTFGRP
ncbi:CBM96 family carbohydrate-binding protein [Actinacidiphila acididurans]|uniref:Fibronectin type III domain-containing protein n=1 Tax=Actinacidiphila acididurans TaxID=2784346 RepID=A0ABS2TLD9_9ACTN|nr:DNRLRE domain-containing protein [Actinacidiphila acididurans]MBM9503321.1 fibronectin type III domain-containing protein [Actinacidiphila acididurans]